MTYIGDFRTGKTIRKMWNSNAVAGGSITRATNGTISVYKDGSTTQSTTGVTDTEDFDSLTGVHLVAVDTSADGTFYSAGSDFEVVLSAATIDSVTVNAALFSFSLENRSHLMPTTDGRKLDVSAGGEAGLDWANVGSPTTTVGLSGTTVKTATDVETDTADIQSRLPAALTGDGNIKADTLRVGGTLQTAGDIIGDTNDIQSKIGTPAGASVSADIAAVKSDSAAILVDTGTTLDGRIPAALTAGGNMKTDILAIDGDTDAPTRLKRGTLSTVLGTCDAGGNVTTVIALSLTATAVDDQFIGRLIIFDTGTTTTGLRGQATAITDYTHASKTFVVSALTTAPATGDTFTVL